MLLAGGIVSADPLRLAATTSIEDSGLLAKVLLGFTEETGVEIQAIAVGTGKALELGEAGDVDVVLVHAPALERAFVEAGHGVDHRAVMYNDFVIVGPNSDPAGIRGQTNAVEALARLAKERATFVSRGDESGTHLKERELWKTASMLPHGRWYREAGQGMGRILQMAEELDAYTLADRGTWLAMKSRLSNLSIAVEGDSRLFNRYGVIAVNPAKYAGIGYPMAKRFIDWLTSPNAQRLIGDFTVDGEVLFHPTTQDLP